MTLRRTHNQQPTAGRAPTVGELIERLKEFEGPPEHFLVSLLAVQCALSQAGGGAILHKVDGGDVKILSAYPPFDRSKTTPAWLAYASEAVDKAGTLDGTRILPLHGSEDLYGQRAQRHLVIIPLKMANLGQAAGVFRVESGNEDILKAGTERLELTANLLSLYEMRVRLEKRQKDISRLSGSLEILAEVNRNEKFASAAMAFCNEMAGSYDCDRVSIGFLEGRYVKLRAISHSENFSRKMKLVQSVESAMEESLDQNIEVLYPAAAEATYLSRAAGELSKEHGGTRVLSLPLRRQGNCEAVVTAEIGPERQITVGQIEAMRLACELCSPRLFDLYERDRWFGAKAAKNVRSAAAMLVGARYTWAKIVAVLLTAAVLFMIFAKGTYKPQSPFVIEAAEQRMVPTPFAGFINAAYFERGDIVQAGEVISELDTAELRLQLADARAQREAYLKEADTARGQMRTAEAQIAEAQAEMAQARIELLEYKISKAQIVSPVRGTIVEGELKRRVGAPVETGEGLFKIAVLDSLRAELMVDESLIAEIDPGQTGELATASFPSRKIGLTVDRINPIAEVVDGRNVFRVRVELADNPAWLRPGMEGVAKISVAKRSYAWIWTRKLVNWVRMKLWF